MAFFDNWRVQLTMLNVLDDEVETYLANRERDYEQACMKGDAASQNAIFVEYQYCTMICQNALRFVRNNRMPADGWAESDRVMPYCE